MKPVSLSTARHTTDEIFARIAEGLVERGYAVLPAALPAPILADLQQTLAEIDEAEFRRARIGRGRGRTLNRFVRTDQIHWIQPDDDAYLTWLDWTEQLRTYLNQHLFLGLFSFESHFAIYRRGAFYKRHVDAFKGEANRTVSLVTYLNRGWQPDQGGELVIDVGEGEQVRVTPEAGTIVVFLSEDFPHEILPTQRERYSVSGWFRLNTSLLDRIDPPA